MKNIKRKILLVSPYLDILGGGEQHIFSILKIFDKQGYESNIVWKDSDILSRLNTIHNINFDNAQVIPSVPLMKDYDYCLFVTDGSYFFSNAKHKYAFYMYPKKEITPDTFVKKLKTIGWSFFANGEFTAEKMETITGKHIEVIHPFIDEQFFDVRKKKEKLIISVGRFFPHLHSKRQDVLIDAFSALQERESRFKEYSLLLIGGLTDKVEDKEFFAMLQKKKGNNPSIIFKTNARQEELLSEYHSASIYWHAGGYGLDEDKNPEGVEHLGITPLQGMAAGAVTMCHNSGGPRRYIKSGVNGLLYDTTDDLVQHTIALNNSSMQGMREKGVEYVKNNFSLEIFEKTVVDYFKL